MGKKKVKKSTFSDMHIKVVWKKNIKINYPMRKNYQKNSDKIFLGKRLFDKFSPQPEKQSDKKGKKGRVGQRRAVKSKHVAVCKQAEEIVKIGKIGKNEDC